jgi:NTP pyrophosphatase (non-canonical NTP hydrolase)
MDQNLYAEVSKLASSYLTALARGSETVTVNPTVSWIQPSSADSVSGAFSASIRDMLRGLVIEGTGSTPDAALKGLRSELVRLSQQAVDNAVRAAEDLAKRLGIEGNVLPQNWALPALRRVALALDIGTEGRIVRDDQLLLLVDEAIRKLHGRFADLTDAKTKAEADAKAARAMVTEADAKEKQARATAAAAVQERDEAWRAIDRLLQSCEVPTRDRWFPSGSLPWALDEATRRIGQWRAASKVPAPTNRTQTAWGAEQSNKIMIAAKSLFDNRMGENVGEVWAHREFWLALGSALYPNDPRIDALARSGGVAEAARRASAESEKAQAHTLMSMAKAVAEIELGLLGRMFSGSVTPASVLARMGVIRDTLKSVRGSLVRACEIRGIALQQAEAKGLPSMATKLAMQGGPGDRAEVVERKLETIRVRLLAALGLTPKQAEGVDIVGTACDVIKERWDAYQEETGRTYDAASVRRSLGIPETEASKASEIDVPGLLMCALGLAGEAGEVAEAVKKFVFHGKGLRVDDLRKELGDVLWYLSRTAAAAGIALSSVPRENVRKLRERYPDGFAKGGGRRYVGQEIQVILDGVKLDPFTGILDALRDHGRLR